MPSQPGDAHRFNMQRWFPGYEVHSWDIKEICSQIYWINITWEQIEKISIMSQMSNLIQVFIQFRKEHSTMSMLS